MKNHLMHPRAANNYRSNGYFPTDTGTLEAIAAKLEVPAPGTVIRAFDPCCGEGHALAYLAEHLTQSGAECQSFGVELDHNRAEAAQDRLSHTIRADIENCILQASAVGLLFLNPPYGFTAKDQLSNQRTKRLEEIFFDKTFGTLQAGGVLVLIVPEAALTEHLTRDIATSCTDVRIFRAAVDTYRQYVIIGIRPKNKATIGKKLADSQQRLLMDYQSAPDCDSADTFRYRIPPVPGKVFRPMSFVLEQDVLDKELKQQHSRTLWPHFGRFFGAVAAAANSRRPLCELGQWHAALALAAGQVHGIVTSENGRRLLVKGSTHKTKVNTKMEEYDNNGRLVVTMTALDRFVPSIRAIDLTQNTPDFGRVLTIK
ncbi:DNA methylase [Neisseria arctica]|uniref:DNA methylase n=2 Tax=Neisseria arctica TaxID=1470200 RepID=A0A0J1C5H6_9NEIS|nr:DNA methylase [Neisseria arctica]UOO85688.1 DUF6094 domain-containing protein [Neisseria arctica]